MNEADHPLTRIGPGSPVIVYLHSPREKLWGLLYELNAAGIFLRDQLYCSTVARADTTPKACCAPSAKSSA